MYKQIKTAIKPLFGEDKETYKKVKAEIKKVVSAPKKLSFVVEYPWGTTYVEEMERVLEAFGFKTANDPALEGTDEAGFFFAKDQAALDKMEEAFKIYEEVDSNDEKGWEKAFNKYNESLDKIKGLFHIGQDWKHLDITYDKKFLKKAGLKITEGEDGEITVERTPAKSQTGDDLDDLELQMSRVNKKLKNMALELKNSGIQVVSIDEGDLDADASINLEKGLHIQVGDGYLSLNKEEGTDDDWTIKYLKEDAKKISELIPLIKKELGVKAQAKDEEVKRLLYKIVYEMHDELAKNFTSKNYGRAGLTDNDLRFRINLQDNLLNISYPQSEPSPHEMGVGPVGFSDYEAASKKIDEVANKYANKITNFVAEKGGKIEDREVGSGNLFLVSDAFLGNSFKVVIKNRRIVSAAASNVRKEAERIYNLPAAQEVMKEVSSRFPNYNDIASSDHEEAIQYILDSIDSELEKLPKKIQDAVRSELNDMISGGLA